MIGIPPPPFEERHTEKFYDERRIDMKKVAFMVVSLILAAALAGCGAELEAYDMADGDAVPSITSVVGEREVTGVQSSVSNGVTTKEYTYVSDTVYDDLLSYVRALMDEGWLVTQDIDLNVVPGSGELAAHSSEEGQVILVGFTYDDAGYVITVTKGKGTLE
jgi:hypothetical protein